MRQIEYVKIALKSENKNCELLVRILTRTGYESDVKLLGNFSLTLLSCSLFSIAQLCPGDLTQRNQDTKQKIFLCRKKIVKFNRHVCFRRETNMFPSIIKMTFFLVYYITRTRVLVVLLHRVVLFYRIIFARKLINNVDHSS